MIKVRNIVLLTLASGSLWFLSACSTDKQTAGFEFMPDMYRSPSYKTYEASPITGDSASALLPVKGTIPRGHSFFNYPSSTEGYEAAGAELKNPFPYNEINLAEGAQLYQDFCVHCHGKTGDGQGSLVKNGKYPPPPSYTSDLLKDLPVGKMFWTITYGKNLMGSHASQLTPEERWKVIMHVEKLQKGSDVAASDVSENNVSENSEETIE